MTLQKEKGNKGEEMAIAYLLGKSYTILEHNYFSRFGEIDIIAMDKDTLVFVEVKNFRSNSLVSAFRVITNNKRKKIITTARYYLMKKNLADTPARFDVIILENGRIIEHLEGAFFI